jgi:hypothetical protein
MAEFAAFGKKRWVAAFESAGFHVEAVKPVGFNSGYGFGYDRLRGFMERIHFHTAYVYILRKQGRQSRHIKYFM